VADECVPGTMKKIGDEWYECLDGEWVLVDPIARPAREPGLDLAAPYDETDPGGEVAEADS
jgi:hypothetical protein